MPAISLLIKPASGNCNMRCKYCFYMDEQKNRSQAVYGFMDDRTLRNLLRKMLKKAEGVCNIAFQGGEPTLVGIEYFKNVVKYVELYNKNQVKIQYALQTNGFAMDEEWCQFLRDHQFLVGLSVDGTKEIHDTYRRSVSGAPTYENVRKAAELMDAYKVEYNILTVVHRAIAENAKAVYEEYKRNGWAYQQYIACLDPLNEVLGSYEYSLKPEAYGDFLIELFDCWYEDLKEHRQPYIRQFENYIGILLGMMPEACDQRGTCGIQYVVEADGSVYPCDFYMLDEYLLGNINDTAISCMDQKREEIGFVEKSLHITEKCRSCKYAGICRGGCMRQRQQAAEGMYENYFCTAYQRFFEKCMGKIEKIAREVR